MLGRLGALFHPPGGAVLGEELQERHRVERLGSQDARPAPRSGREQLERHDRVDRRLPDDGLGAVASPGLLVVDHAEQIDLARLAVGTGPRQPRTGGAPSPPPTRISSLSSRPSLCSVLSTWMNSSPRPYLKVTRRQSTHRGIRSTSSCSTFTHSIGPMPSGNTNVSGSENGAVVNQPRSFSQITGGFRHSSMVVQIENEGAKSYPATVMFDPSRTPTSSIVAKS